jgi:hypothetical protein
VFEVVPRACVPLTAVALAGRLVDVPASRRASTCQARASVDVWGVAFAMAGADVGFGVASRALLPWSVVARTGVGWLAACGGPELALRAVPSALAG